MAAAAPPASAEQWRRQAAVALAGGDAAAAAELLERAHDDTRRRLGPLHPDCAELSAALAAAYSAGGRDRDALGSQRQALEILEALHGTADPAYLRALADAAQLQQRAGDFDGAERSYRQAATGLGELAGRPLETAQCHARLAWLLFAQGRTEAALATVADAEDWRDRATRELLRAGPEQTRQEALAQIQAGYQLWLAIALDRRWRGAATAASAFGLVQRRKLLGLHYALARRLKTGTGPAEKDLRSQWARLRRQLAEAFSSLGENGGERVRKIHDRRLALEELERRIAAGMAEDGGAPSSRPDILAAALPANTALVELVRYDGHRLPESPRELPRPAGQPRYAAFVLRRDSLAPALTDLGPAGEIDPLVSGYRRLLASHGGSASRGLIDEEEDDPSESPGERLRALLVEPLEQALGGCRRLLFAMDGELALLPVETLPDRTAGHYLADRYLISYLGAGREWLELAGGGDTTAPVVVAAPRFGSRWRLPPGLCTAGRGTPPSRRKPRPEFAPLPGSRVEGEWVAALLRARLLTGRRASKPAVLGLSSPRILHIASHGYFRSPAPPAAARGEWTDPPDSPMLRAGLALAGANGTGGAGLLSAEEIATLELHGTELVVLSACDSGAGETTAGEGVSGLRRALALAGARSQLVSLWKVDDRAAALLMAGFYRLLAEPRLSRAEALARAKAQLRRLTLGELRQRWERSGAGSLAEFAGWPDHRRPFDHPFYWGAFVLSGATGPLASPP